MINKKAGVSVQGGTKSKNNLIDIFSNSNLFKDTKPYSVHRLDKETSGAVSYTHLRAHETRHDLVCRLLLEKKKN